MQSTGLQLVLSITLSTALSITLSTTLSILSSLLFSLLASLRASLLPVLLLSLFLPLTLFVRFSLLFSLLLFARLHMWDAITRDVSTDKFVLETWLFLHESKLPQALSGPPKQNSKKTHKEKAKEAKEPTQTHEKRKKT